MSSTPEHRKAFVERLNFACDNAKLIPPKGEGRQEVIATSLHVASEAVSKWFKGVSMPRQPKMRELADLLGVDVVWLQLGEDPEMDRGARRLYAKESDGAMHLVWGLIALSGGHCGYPADNDPRRQYVDFYAVVRGTVHPMRITLAREVAPNNYEIAIAKEYAELHTVAVLPLGGGKFTYLDMPVDLIERTKTMKGSGFSVLIEKVSTTRYVTGDTQWPRIVSFAEFAAE